MQLSKWYPDPVLLLTALAIHDLCLSFALETVFVNNLGHLWFILLFLLLSFCIMCFIDVMYTLVE